MRGRALALVASCLTVFLLAACSSFREVFHFKATGTETTNYYRVTVSGSTWFSQSQYACGLYDAEAVDNLFGELQGASIRALSETTSNTKMAEAKPGTEGTAEGERMTSRNTGSVPNDELTSLDGQPIGDKKLVFFLSANSNAVVGKISAFVKSREIQDSMVGLILKDDVADLEMVKASAKSEDARAELIGEELKTIAAEVEATAAGAFNAAAAEKILARVMTVLARRSTDGTRDLTFADVATGIAWEASHPGAFLVEGGR